MPTGVLHSWCHHPAAPGASHLCPQGPAAAGSGSDPQQRWLEPRVVPQGDISGHGAGSPSSCWGSYGCAPGSFLVGGHEVFQRKTGGEQGFSHHDVAWARPLPLASTCAGWGARGGGGSCQPGYAPPPSPRRWMISLLILNATRLFPFGKKVGAGREGNAWGSPQSPTCAHGLSCGQTEDAPAWGRSDTGAPVSGDGQSGHRSIPSSGYHSPSQGAQTPGLAPVSPPRSRLPLGWLPAVGTPLTFAFTVDQEDKR